MIKPTIGRVVWFTLDQETLRSSNGQPSAAIITYVHSDTMVNLVTFTANGESVPRTSVYLRQPEVPTPEQYYAEWMPYQTGQAAKTEALEKELAVKD